MATEAIYTKSLGGAEDLLLDASNSATVIQTRAGKELEITKINSSTIPYSGKFGDPSMVSIKDQLDSSAYVIDTVDDFGTVPSGIDTVIVKDNNRGGTFIYDATQSAVNNGGTIFDGWVRQYSGAVNVRWFGANETRLDNNVPIQLAITTCKHAEVPNDIVLITSESITIGLGEHLVIGANSTISAQFTEDKPVVRIISSYARLSGNGYSSIVQTNRKTGGLSSYTIEGVINVGPINETTPTNIGWSSISKIMVKGVEADWDNWVNNSNTAIDDSIGIKLVNGDIYNQLLSNSLYNSSIDNVLFNNLGTGLDLGPVVQGNNFNNIYFYKCSKYGIRMSGSKENSVNQTFFHFSPGIVMVKLETSPASLPFFGERTSSYNSFTNLMGEPGATGYDGRYARFCEIDTDNGQNYLQGRGNTGHAYIDYGTENTIIENGKVDAPSSKFTLGESIISSVVVSNNFTNITNSDYSNIFKAQGSVKKRLGRWTFSAGNRKKIATINLPDYYTVAKITVRAYSGELSSSTNSWGYTELILRAYNRTTSGTYITVQELNSTNESIYGGLLQPEVSGKVITFAYNSEDATQVVVDVDMEITRLGTDNAPAYTISALDGQEDSTAPAFLTYFGKRTRSITPTVDNTYTLGVAEYRWSTAYFGSAAIVTSDNRSKTYLDINESEILVAKELKTLMKKFKLNDSIEVKGLGNARIHYGTSAQEVKATFEKYGLIAEDYAILCYDEWEAEYEQVIDTEAELDKDGNVIKEATYKEVLTREAGDRYGIRYEELLCFIISAM